jgi:8-hydroxy-5-deazaflavin:NADPH oxidoreductase
MKIGIIGAGNVGATLGAALARAGHSVDYGVRAPDDDKHAALRASGAGVSSVPGSVAAAEAVILATPWSATQAALASAGDFAGKPLLDATNPIGSGLTLTHGHTDSGGEQVARWAKGARVVKVFNTTGLENMANPAFGEARAAMWVCGDDEGAREIGERLARDLGFDAISVGALSRARLLEPAAALWMVTSRALGTRDVAFALLRR